MHKIKKKHYQLSLVVIIICVNVFANSPTPNSGSANTVGKSSTKEVVPYKCLFNYEGLIFCTFMKDRVPVTTGPAYIAAFVDKLKDTDVDAVMFCPMAWRTNIYPSEVDPRWKEYNDTWNNTKYKGLDYIMKYII